MKNISQNIQVHVYKINLCNCCKIYVIFFCSVIMLHQIYMPYDIMIYDSQFTELSILYFFNIEK